jgi:hypothetical protein
MHLKIQAILERELDKINQLSLEGNEPLTPADIRSLDTLIKAYRTLVAPESDKPAAKTTETESTEDLLHELNAVDLTPV